MKRMVLCVLAALVAIIGCAQAAEINMLDGVYTDVPSVMTQDAVVDIELDQECTAEILQPDTESMALLEKVYDFVWRLENRPVRYYDEETQEKIQALVPEVDIDILHMTEFMALDLEGEPENIEPEEAVRFASLLDVDYRPGQLVVAVFGILEEDGEYRWFPYRAEVPATGLIEFDVPDEEYEILAEEDQVIYHVLTNRVGARGDILIEREIIRTTIDTPSKGSRDIITIRYWYSSTGEVIDDLFSIFIVEKTEEINDEITRIGEFIAEGNAPIEWFPEEMQSQAGLLLEDVDLNEMIIYDIEAVMAKDYKDTYGDVATENLFASAYSPDSRMVVMLGFPMVDEDGEPCMEWYCLRAEAVEEIVEVVFKQLVIPRMETEPAMLVVLSEPLVEDAE